MVLEKSETSRPAFASCCRAYLQAQEQGAAFPKQGVPMIGHIKRVWREYLPGTRRSGGRVLKPWLAPYTSTPAPMYESQDVSSWLNRHRAELHAIRTAIAEHGGGEVELRRWLAPRVDRPDDVIAALRAGHQEVA